MEYLEQTESVSRPEGLGRLPPSQWLAWLLCIGLLACMTFAICLLCALLSSCSPPAFGPASGGPDELPADCFRMELPSCAGQPDPDGLVRVLIAPDFGAGRELYLPGGQKSLLEFRKNRPAAVLAYLPGGERPYGAVYPYTAGLQAKDGFAAEILWELYRDGGTFSEDERTNIRLFNWHKLLEVLREQDDPWLVDSERLKEAIRAGKFSKSKVKKWVKDPS